MGNSIGGRKKVKVMKINGETLKLKIPVRVWDVVKDYPGYVLLDSEAVKHFGVRAKPLEPQMELKPKKIYFLVELPKFQENHDPDHHHKETRRVRSNINVSAKDRLELLMLSRRTVSDLSMVRQSSSQVSTGGPAEPGPGPVRLKMRLPRSQVAKLVEESKDEAEVANKIIDCYMNNGIQGGGGGGGDLLNGEFLRRDQRLKGGLGLTREDYKAHQEVQFTQMRLAICFFVLKCVHNQSHSITTLLRTNKNEEKVKNSYQANKKI
ncbi:hypothetical protein UlMin_023984 [Ulmus minor]